MAINFMTCLKEFLSSNSESNLLTKLDSHTSQRIFIKSILNIHGENSFLVTKEQVDLFKARSKEFGDYSSPTDWLDLVWPEEGNILFGNNKSIINDQMERAQQIIDYMIHNNMYTIKTMDGHGRFVSCLIKCLIIRGKNPNDYTIQLADIDIPTNNWHVAFLPDNVEVLDPDIGHNILSVPTNLLGNSCLYMNFCSIGDNAESLLAYLDDSFSDPSVNHSIFISYSDRGIGFYSPLGYLNNKIKMFGKLISNRGNFKTYELSNWDSSFIEFEEESDESEWEESEYDESDDEEWDYDESDDEESDYDDSDDEVLVGGKRPRKNQSSSGECKRKK